MRIDRRAVIHHMHPDMPMPALETARIERAYLMQHGVALKG